MLNAILIGVSAGLTLAVCHWGLLIVVNWGNKQKPQPYLMTRRDYFAANAMNALIMRPDAFGTQETIVAAFEIADIVILDIVSNSKMRASHQ